MKSNRLAILALILTVWTLGDAFSVDLQNGVIKAGKKAGGQGADMQLGEYHGSSS